MTVIGPPVRLGNRPRRDGRDPSCADQRLADDPWTEARGAALRGSRGIPEPAGPARASFWAGSSPTTSTSHGIFWTSVPASAPSRTGQVSTCYLPKWKVDR